jgi:PhnB protein
MMVNSASILQDSGIAVNILVRGLEEATRFYQAAFGAQCMVNEEGAGRSRVHARFRIGNSLLNISTDGTPSNQDQRGPSGELSTGTCFELFVTDIDAALNRALNAGATVLKDRTPGHFGDDCRFIVDPFGYVWCVSVFMNDGGALCV